MGKSAGIVDLCPCIRLTYRGKQKLVEDLRLDAHRPRDLDELDYSNSSPHLWHMCKIPGPRCFVMRIFPVLKDYHLKIVTTYEHVPDTGNRWGKKIPTRLACPHLSVLTYIDSVERARRLPNAPYTVPFDSARKSIYCQWCDTEIGDFSTTSGEARLNATYFKTSRDLGLSAQLPDEMWFVQTVYSSDTPRDSRGLDSQPFLGLARFRPDLFPSVSPESLSAQGG